MTSEWKITLGLVFAIALQAAAAFVWAGQASARLREVEQRTLELRSSSERLARVEVRMDEFAAQLDRIERKLDSR